MVKTLDDAIQLMDTQAAMINHDLIYGKYAPSSYKYQYYKELADDFKRIEALLMELKICREAETEGE